MLKITSTLDLFAEHIRNKTPLYFGNKGEWQTRRGPHKWIYRISRLQNRELKHLTEKFIETLDAQERQKIYFNCSRAEGQTELFRAYLSAGQALCDRYGSKRSAELYLLQQRLEGLRYRIEETFGGQPPLPRNQISAESAHLQQLCYLALDWKKQQPYPDCDKHLSRIDHAKLAETAQYTSYMMLLLQDDDLRHSFFKWALRDCNDIASFIQYPSTCEKLHKNYIEPRIGYFGGLAISSQACRAGGTKKVLTQPFKVAERTIKNISILNEEKEITLHGCPQRLKIHDIFNVFRNKNLDIGDIEYLGHYEFYNCKNAPLDLDDPNLIANMKTLRSYTFEEMKRAYSIPHLQPGQWIKIYRATRSSDKLTVEGCHAFLEIAMPTATGYEIKSCGILAATYPKTWWQKLAFLGKTVFGKLYSPDDNFAMLTRQQCAAPFILESDEEVQELTEQVRTLFKEGRENRLVFQAGGDNCSAKVQKAFLSTREKQPDRNGKVKNLFLVPFIKTTPMEPLGSCFKFLRRCPASMQRLYIRFLEIIFGGYTTLKLTDASGHKTTLSLSRSAFHRDQKIYTPTLLFKKIEKNKIPGIIWYGPDPLRSRVEA